jgi:hypothetical protein
MMLKGISPKAAVFGIPRAESKLNTVKVSAKMTKNEIAMEPRHPERFCSQSRICENQG